MKYIIVISLLVLAVAMIIDLINNWEQVFIKDAFGVALLIALIMTSFGMVYAAIEIIKS